MSPKCNRCHQLYFEVWVFNDEEREVYMPQGCRNYQGYLQVMITITEKRQNYKFNVIIQVKSSHELVFM